MANENSYQAPTEDFIHNSLTYGLLEGTPVNQPVQGSFYGDSDSKALSRNRGKFARKLIHFAYENKGRIKRMPILGNFALYIKRNMMRKNSPDPNQHIPKLDLSGIMGLEGYDFIQQLYILALGRTPDVESLNNARRALFTGLPKEALVCAVCTSEEFANRAQVAHLRQYRKIYSRYLLRERLKHLPVIGRIWALVTLPSRINSLSLQIESLDARLNVDREKLISKIDWSFESIDRKIANIISVVDVANQNIINANVKIDNTAKNRPFVYGLPGGVTAVQAKEFVFGVPS